ncbi:MAG TPA: hypothetical protein VIW67_07105 [Terriglobales bacterium]|jgi:hypothetical protein
MQMIIIRILSVVLACLPLLMATFFLLWTVPRKLLVVKQDLRKLSYGSHEVTPNSVVAEPDVQELMDKYFGTFTLLLPALLLSFFYVAGFLLCDSFLTYQYNNDHSLSLFPVNFVIAARPVFYAFIGAYLFNLGTMVRRVYLSDLNEQVFWGSLNRILLTLGLAVVFLKIDLPGASESTIYFSIGFISNIFLEWLIEKSLKILNWSKPKQDDLPLQMIRGIDIWKEYRLEEEGIENVQNLATADVVELAVRTHYNFRTLIDWVDQAILLSRLTTDQAKKLSDQAVSLSAIDLAAASPASARDETIANAIADTIGVNKVLMSRTMNSLYEDRFVRDLWSLWQSKTEVPITPGG